MRTVTWLTWVLLGAGCAAGDDKGARGDDTAADDTAEDDTGADDTDPIDRATGELPLADGYAVWWGEATNDEAGRSVDHAGDVNGDGQEDFVTGAQRNDRGASGAGAGYLVLGPLDAAEHGLEEASAAILGANADDFAGAAIAAGLDVDGDGFSDLLVDAQDTDDAGDGSGTNYLFYGPVTGEHLTTDADGWMVGEDWNDNAGQSVALVSDGTGDGSPDVLLGAQAADTAGDRSGTVYLVEGPVSGELSLGDAWASLLGEAEGDRAGGYCRGGTADGRDINGDGVGDVLVGAFGWWPLGGYDGQAYVLYGPVAEGTSSLGDADAKLVGSDEEMAGLALVAADVDGDGYDDVLTGGADRDEAVTEGGVVYAVYGPLDGAVALTDAPVRLWGEVEYGHAGFAIDAGDIDRDGALDLATGGGAFGRTSTPEGGGHAYVVYGPLPTGGASLEDADRVFTASNLSEQAGVSVSLGGDLTGDGVMDLLVGSWNNAHVGLSAGAVFVVSGAAD